MTADGQAVQTSDCSYINRDRSSKSVVGGLLSTAIWVGSLPPRLQGRGLEAPLPLVPAEGPTAAKAITPGWRCESTVGPMPTRSGR